MDLKDCHSSHCLHLLQLNANNTHYTAAVPGSSNVVNRCTTFAVIQIVFFIFLKLQISAIITDLQMICFSPF